VQRSGFACAINAGPRTLPYPPSGVVRRLHIGPIASFVTGLLRFQLQFPNPQPSEPFTPTPTLCCSLALRERYERLTCETRPMKTFAICLRGRTSTLLTFAGLFILAWNGLYAKAPLPAPVLAGQPVLEEEYTFYMEQLRTEVASRFMREHGVEQSEAFWKTPIGGKSPEDLLQEATLRAIARHRVLLQLGVESGILKKVLRYPELVSLFHARKPTPPGNA
jgi:hypothetical protein